MNRTLIIYPTFLIACLLVAAVFITSKTYTQLGVAILLYPLVAFFAYKIMPPKLWTYTKKQSAKPQDSFQGTAAERLETGTKSLGIADIDKRAFLKLIGATGISFFLISIFGQKVQSLLFGQNLAQTGSLTGNPPAGQTGAAAASPTDGYSISEVDDGIVSYYGFINKEGAWFIMKGDTDNGTFRYTRGKSDFPGNWKKRQNLDYDYFHQVFP